MTALILVVDDLEPNVKLLEAKLAAEYYDVVVAHNGIGAIQKAKEHQPDLILLDVMMPEMDGFEACKRIKADPATGHIPVVMVTALSEPSDRVQGLQSGADDFLTKPINDVQLLARVKSLVRMKQLIDEVRLRGQTSQDIGEVTGVSFAELGNIQGSRVLIVDDDVVQNKNVQARLAAEQLQVAMAETGDKAMQMADAGNFDLIIVSTQLTDTDGLRLCSQFRSHESTRHVPQLILIEDGDQRSLIKGLEMGVNDYLMNPVDLNEMVCRVKTNIRRKKYQDSLKNSYKETVNMAIKDNLTGLYNRHYLNAHLDNLAKSSLERSKPLCCMMMDMDHFKQVNDTYGHDVGDEVLKELARRIVGQLRGSDLVARFGGEEFVIILPGCPVNVAMDVADRIRGSVEKKPFKISHPAGQINKTISIGVAMLNNVHEQGKPSKQLVEELLKHADEALYTAKETGRNQAVLYKSNINAGAAGAMSPVAAPPLVAPKTMPPHVVPEARQHVVPEARQHGNVPEAPRPMPQVPPKVATAPQPAMPQAAPPAPKPVASITPEVRRHDNAPVAAPPAPKPAMPQAPIPPAPVMPKPAMANPFLNAPPPVPPSGAIHSVPPSPSAPSVASVPPVPAPPPAAPVPPSMTLADVLNRPAPGSEQAAGVTKRPSFGKKPSSGA